jgi:hypothetical protein
MNSPRKPLVGDGECDSILVIYPRISFLSFRYPRQTALHDYISTALLATCESHSRQNERSEFAAKDFPEEIWKFECFGGKFLCFFSVTRSLILDGPRWMQHFEEYMENCSLQMVSADLSIKN